MNIRKREAVPGRIKVDVICMITRAVSKNANGLPVARFEMASQTSGGPIKIAMTANEMRFFVNELKQRNQND